MNSLSIYIARSADRYVVVDQEPKADVVVGRHRDFRDRDEVEDLLCGRGMERLLRGA